MADAAYAFTGDEALELSPQNQAPLLAALDIGISKTTCLAARRDPVLDMHPDRPLRVAGVGVQAAPAIASGKPADFDACARSVRVALDEAAYMAGGPITRVTASYSGPGLSAQIVRGQVRTKAKIVQERDLFAALAAAEALHAPNETVLHVEPLRYFVDDGEAMPDPVGEAGKRLAVEACIVTAPKDAIDALKACVRAAGAEVDYVIAGPQAAGIAALTADEREEGALLLDIGAGALGMAVFAAEGLVHAETLPIGGVRMSRDLAKRLDTTFAAAERVKLAYGVVGGNFDPRDSVPAPRLGAEGRLEQASTLRGVIAETLSPRFRDMLVQARCKLAKAGFGGETGPHRAVMVGGGALMLGAREMAAEVFGMPVRIARPFDLTGFDSGEAGPAYAVSAGLLRWRFEHPDLADVDGSFQPSLAGAARALRDGAANAFDWLRANF